MFRTSPVFVFLFVILLSTRVVGDDKGSRYGLCMSMYFDVEKEKMKLEAELSNIETNLRETEQLLKSTKRLLADIERAKTYGTEKEIKDAELAEPFAKKALSDIQLTRKKLEEQRLTNLALLNRLEEEEKNLSEVCKKLVSEKSEGIIRQCSGDVRIINKEQHERTCSQYSILREGDEITTGRDGSAVFHLLNGRGRIVIKPNTMMRVGEDIEEDQILEFKKGEARFDIEKAKTYEERIKVWSEKYSKEYKEDMERFEQFKKQKLKGLKLYLCEIIRPGRCHYPQAILGVRGTSFVISRIEGNKVKIVVNEGAVEVNIVNSKEPCLIEQGKEAIIDFYGRINIKDITQ